jgi:hypothetical protein
VPRQILQITKELTYGVFDTTGTPTAIDLPDGNAFTMRVDPDFWKIKSAAADNLTVQTGTATSDIDGSLDLYVRPSETPLIMNMISGVTGSCPNLPSFTIDHAIALEGSCTYVYRRYLGVMGDGGFALTNSGQGVIMMMKLKLMASKIATITITDFPTPTFASYNFANTNNPWDFTQLSGHFTYGGADISANVESLSFNIGNVLVAQRGASKFRSNVFYRGRNPTITLKQIYNTNQPRIDFEANTAKPLVLTFNDSVPTGGDTLVMNFGNVNYLRQVGDDLNMGSYFVQTLMLENIVDPATGTDMSITYTPHT